MGSNLNRKMTIDRKHRKHNMNSITRLTLIGLAFTLSSCQAIQSRFAQAQTPEAPATLAPAPQISQDGTIQVYMNHSEASQYRDPDRAIDRSGDNLEQVLLTAIQSAKQDIQIAVQEFRLPRIAQALAQRAQAGVKIQVILEHAYAKPYSSFSTEDLADLTDRERKRYDDNRSLIDADQDGALSETEIQTRDALVILDRAGIKRSDDRSKNNGLMHHKFMVIDGKQTIVTSANWTRSDIHGDLSSPGSRGNANNLLKIESPAVAQVFQEEFKLLAAHQFQRKKRSRSPQTLTVGNSTVTIQFSPSHKRKNWNQSTNGLIASTAVQAKESIDIATFVFSDAKLSKALAPLSARAVKIRALIDSDFMFRSYSIGLDMLGVPVPCRKKSESKPWLPAIETVGIPRLAPGDLLHHKFAVVDRITVITGSHNWTQAGNHSNDETLLIIKSPTVAAHYQREFDRLYKNAKLGINPDRPICKGSKESE